MKTDRFMPRGPAQENKMCFWQGCGKNVYMSKCVSKEMTGGMTLFRSVQEAKKNMNALNLYQKKSNQQGTKTCRSRFASKAIAGTRILARSAWKAK